MNFLTQLAFTTNPYHTLVMIAFWASISCVGYSYLGYAVLITSIARAFGVNLSRPSLENEVLPMISILIAAHNEEDVIAERIDNALTLDYPSEKMDIVVASDASNDGTNEIVERYSGRGVRLLDYCERRGKAAVLNRAMKEVSGTIVLLSDANTHMESASARSLVKWFADPAVGVVCGKLILSDRGSGRNADASYWKYETFLKIQEARLGALLGSNGAIYAIRQSVFQPIPDQTIIDDFVIPLMAMIRTGCGIVYDPDAVACEETAANHADEFRRRVRIGAGGWQAIGMLWPLLDPRRGWIALAFLSHKVLRWMCPFFLLLALATNLLLLQSPLYRYFFVVQLVGYALAIAGAFVSGSSAPARVLRLANLFVATNAALLGGFFRWSCRPQSGIWTRTKRGVESHSAEATITVSAS